MDTRSEEPTLESLLDELAILKPEENYTELYEKSLMPGSETDKENLRVGLLNFIADIKAQTVVEKVTNDHDTLSQTFDAISKLPKPTTKEFKDFETRYSEMLSTTDAIADKCYAIKNESTDNALAKYQAASKYYDGILGENSKEFSKTLETIKEEANSIQMTMASQTKKQAHQLVNEDSDDELNLDDHLDDKKTQESNKVEDRDEEIKKQIEESDDEDLDKPQLPEPDKSKAQKQTFSNKKPTDDIEGEEEVDDIESEELKFSPKDEDENDPETREYLKQKRAEQKFLNEYDAKKMNLIRQRIKDGTYLNKIEHIEAKIDKLQHSEGAKDELDEYQRICNLMRKQLKDYENLLKDHPAHTKLSQAEISTLTERVGDLRLRLDSLFYDPDTNKKDKKYRETNKRASYSHHATFIEKDNPTELEEAIKKQLEAYGIGTPEASASLTSVESTDQIGTSPNRARVNHMQFDVPTIDPATGKSVMEPAHFATVQKLNANKNLQTDVYFGGAQIDATRQKGVLLQGYYNNPGDIYMSTAIATLKDIRVEVKKDGTPETIKIGDGVVPVRREYIEALLIYARYLNEFEGKNIVVKNLTRHKDISVSNAQVYGLHDRMIKNRKVNGRAIFDREDHKTAMAAINAKPAELSKRIDDIDQYQPPNPRR